MTLQERTIEKIYQSLYRIRRTEEEIARVYPTDKITSPVHLSIGQEAVSVGVCEALKPQDAVFGTYRGHALYLAKGGDLNRMIAELYGKSTGCAKGKGGSMHLADKAHGVMGMSAVVATTIPVSVGYAYAMKLQKKKSLVVSFFGDGATDEGVFSEAINFAALKKLPIIFVCENNLYAIHTHIKNRQAKPDICKRVTTYGIPTEKFRNDDVLLLFKRVSQIAAWMRRKAAGPYFIEVMTYRWKEHVGPGDDFHLGYRSEKEAKAWMKKDQVARLASMLDPSRRRRIETQVQKEIAAAFDFAERSPAPKPADLYADVFKDPKPRSTRRHGEK